ncbi:Site-specific recombinase XerD [Pilibacter termitis]|uniref:Site-specific recombinase XerD n=1 Tax=Pilibacter termitis TaxID=263852 RepID=A0A1T4L437_9ENTE|nr:site-specific integrase [Pilibacter termitis]SJZ49413.1 Site-specific recombinase XerD [Pilibacter termitis]
MKIIEYTTKKKEIRYIAKGVYIGTDCLTGKPKRTNITGKTKTDVKLKYERAKLEFLQNGSTTREKVSISTFEELAKVWFEMYKTTVKSNTLSQMESLLNVHILPPLKEYKVEKITSYLLQKIVNTWADNANNHNGFKRYSYAFSTVKRILKYAVSLDVIEVNPALNVYIPQSKSDKTIKKIKYFNKQDLKTFLNAIECLSPCYTHEMYKAYFYLLAHTGIRPSEGLAMSWQDVDFTSGTIRITKTLNRKAKLEDSPKTKKSNRTLLLDTTTLQTLKKWKLFQSKEKLKLGVGRANLIFCPIHEESYLFHNTVRNFAKRIFRENGLNDIGLHGFRHTYATMLLSADVPYKIIQERLGHENITMTMNTYSHLEQSKEKQAILLFENYMSL